MIGNVLGYAVVKGIGKLPLFAQRSRALARRRGFGVHAYIGPNGSGKSWTAALDSTPTLRGIPWYCDNPGHRHTRAGITHGLRTVTSTMRFTLPDGRDHPLWIPCDSYTRIAHAEHTDLVLDEVGGAAGSTTGSDDLPFPVKAKLQKLRAVDVVCRHTAPGWMRATKSLRECTSAATLTLGFYPQEMRRGVPFDGEHELMSFDYKRGEVIDGWCSTTKPHVHDSAAAWGSRRVILARTYDANVFEEWTQEKRSKHRPVVRQLIWRPGDPTDVVYDTLAQVLALAQVTESGTCIVCNRKRKVSYCTGNHEDLEVTAALEELTDPAGLPAPLLETSNAP